MKRVLWCLVIATIALLAIQLGVRPPGLPLEEAQAAPAPQPLPPATNPAGDKPVEGAAPAAPSPAQPEPAPSASQTEVLKQLLKLSEEVSRMRGEIDTLKTDLTAEKAKSAAALAAAAAAAPAATVVKAPAPVQAPVTAPPAGTTASAIPAATPPGGEKPVVDEEQARIERQRAIESVQRSGVLLPRKSWEVEPSVTYSHASSNLISIDGFAILPILVIGNIQSLRLERDTFTTAVSARYGLLNNLQLDVSVPYKYERDRFVTQTETDPALSARAERTVADDGLGDVSFGVSYQALYERGNLPDVILSARASAPTGKSIFDIDAPTATTNVATVTELPMGSGVWSVRGGVTAIKSLDPVVLIFNAGYTHSFGRDLTLTSISDSGGGVTTNSVRTTYTPGGVMDFGVAVAIAMNPVFAINLQIGQRISFETDLGRLGAVKGSATNEADLRFGFAWAMTHNTVLNFSAAAGLTEDTPDLTISLALPIKF